jgi:hypothetical protein
MIIVLFLDFSVLTDFPAAQFSDAVYTFIVNSSWLIAIVPRYQFPYLPVPMCLLYTTVSFCTGLCSFALLCYSARFYQFCTSLCYYAALCSIMLRFTIVQLCAMLHQWVSLPKCAALYQLCTRCAIVHQLCHCAPKCTAGSGVWFQLFLLIHLMTSASRLALTCPQLLL